MDQLERQFAPLSSRQQASEQLQGVLGDGVRCSGRPCQDVCRRFARLSGCRRQACEHDRSAWVSLGHFGTICKCTHASSPDSKDLHLNLRSYGQFTRQRLDMTVLRHGRRQGNSQPQRKILCYHQIPASSRHYSTGIRVLSCTTSERPRATSRFGTWYRQPHGMAEAAQRQGDGAGVAGPESRGQQW